MKAWKRGEGGRERGERGEREERKKKEEGKANGLVLNEEEEEEEEEEETHLQGNPNSPVLGGGEGWKLQSKEGEGEKRKWRRSETERGGRGW